METVAVTEGHAAGSGVPARVRELLPVIAARGEDVEKERRLPTDLLTGLREAGCLRMLVPERYGGAQLPLPEVLRVLEAIGGADGSTSWAVGQIALADLLLSCAPGQAAERVYEGGPDVVGAGAVAAKGHATLTPAGGYRVTGQWPLVTGSSLAPWFYLNCVIFDGRAIRTMDDGTTPMTRMMVLPASDVEVIDTWHAMGLRGTGSHDVRTAQAGCPHERTFTLAGHDPETSKEVFAVGQAGLIVAATLLGIASGMVRQAAELAMGGKQPTFSPRRLSRSREFQDRLGEAHLDLSAARALLYDTAERSFRAWDSGGRPSPLDRALLRACVAKVAGLVTGAARTAFSLAGSSAVYDSSALQRGLRDLTAGAQHFVCGRDFYAVTGALLVQEEPAIRYF